MGRGFDQRLVREEVKVELWPEMAQGARQGLADRSGRVREGSYDLVELGANPWRRDGSSRPRWEGLPHDDRLDVGVARHRQPRFFERVDVDHLVDQSPRPVVRNSRRFRRSALSCSEASSPTSSKVK